MDNTLKKAIKSACLLNNLEYRVGYTIFMDLFKQYREIVSSQDLDEDSEFINFRIINLGLFYGKYNSNNNNKKEFNDSTTRE